ncbi:hypothetical protein POM88_033611 [Heracleum sosnowskyi]|uniref:Uncharacterized protein n=1 Tax=Heracleum sosnowskyi TaxID=360622 RepID=A0AAD8MCA9_9APIA|nr:hypothetical protein POM88_033611 [Heracleum sosnowskyi]
MKWKPVALPQAKSWHEMSAGLGFNHVNGDFKIIWVGPVGKSESSRVEIYSVKEESCRFRYPDHGKDYVVFIVKLRDVVAALVPSSVQNNVLNLYHLDENSGSWTLMNYVGPLDNRITYAPQCLST